MESLTKTTERGARTKEDQLHDINVIREALGHEWSPEQEALILCGGREILGAGGERAGKSFVASDYFNVRFWEAPRGLYWVIAKDYERCHEEFRYIAEAMLKVGAVKPDNVHTPQNAQWYMKLETGTVIKTWSLKDWLKIGMEAPDGIIVAEVAQITHGEYTRLCTRTMEKRGWVVGTGTFEGSLGWFPELWKLYQLPGQDGKSFSLPSWSNKVVFPGGRNDPEILRLEAKYPADYFMERLGGEPCPPKGLVFKEFKYLTHVKEMEIQDAPCYLWIDPGYAGAYAVEVVQIVGETVQVVDEVYEQGLVTEQIIDICMTKKWWKHVAGGTVDIYAMQHQAMPAVAEVWLEKAHLSLSAQRVDEAAGRERLATFLKVNPIDHQPRFLVDPSCVGILSEFGVAPNPFTAEAAPFKWKEDRVGAPVGKVPDDKNNHGIKAVIYGLIERFGYVTRSLQPREPVSYM